ncbi:MAG: hydroxymyristoyl-ACP dehydratase [Treponema sp.]|nr:hydroxymyristoyl-ACP dehydratase [Treponema sp.]
MSENNHAVINETVISQSETDIKLEVLVPADCDFFDGHFPQFHLLPAVGQFEIVTRFAKKYFKTQRYVPRIRRIKFSAPIIPDTTIHLEMSYNAEKRSVTFTISDAVEKDRMYSTGAFEVVPQDSAK